jgi:hypothetical protein
VVLAHSGLPDPAGGNVVVAFVVCVRLLIARPRPANPTASTDSGPSAKRLITCRATAEEGSALLLLPPTGAPLGVGAAFVAVAPAADGRRVNVNFGRSPSNFEGRRSTTGADAPLAVDSLSPLVPLPFPLLPPSAVCGAEAEADDEFLASCLAFFPFCGLSPVTAGGGRPPASSSNGGGRVPADAAACKAGLRVCA